MATNNTLLCIHRDPVQLSLLQENGFELITATNGCDGLRLFMSRSVDAIVLDYHLGLLDGGVVAAEIKKVKPEVPIVMLSAHVDLPDDALKSVDALVAKSDGPHSLLAMVRSVLDEKAIERNERKSKVQTQADPRRSRRSQEATGGCQSHPSKLASEEKDAPISPGVWRSIRRGNIRF